MQKKDIKKAINLYTLNIKQGNLIFQQNLQSILKAQIKFMKLIIVLFEILQE